MHGHAAGGDLTLERLIGAEEQLLPGLSPRVKRALDLDSAEGARRKQPAIFACKGHSLRHALVDDVDAELGQAVGVSLAGAEIAPLDRVVEQAKHAVAVVAVVLGGVDAPLRGDRVARRGES